MRLRQTATATDGAVIAEVDMLHEASARHEISTRLRLTPGETVVLGDASFDPKGGGPNPGGAQSMVYYVVRATLPDAGEHR